MAKRRYITSSKIESMQKQGRGLGKKDSYKPWITVRDVSSNGFSSRIKGWKTNRVHHLLSNLELSFFYTLEWAANVVDIREKYPLLPIERTLNIASRFNIVHPFDRGKKEPIVMTTDFLVDLYDGRNSRLVAYSIVPSSKANSKRFLEKTFLERTYWNEQGINFFVITEKDIDENLYRNVEFLHDAKKLTFSPGISSQDILKIEPVLYENITDTNLSCSKACKIVDNYFGLEVGVSLWIVRHLIANRLWMVDMYQKILTTKFLQVKRSEKILYLINKEHESYDIGS